LANIEGKERIQTFYQKHFEKKMKQLRIQ